MARTERRYTWANPPFVPIVRFVFWFENAWFRISDRRHRASPRAKTARFISMKTPESLADHWSVLILTSSTRLTFCLWTRRRSKQLHLKCTHNRNVCTVECIWRFWCSAPVLGLYRIAIERVEIVQNHFFASATKRKKSSLWFYTHLLPSIAAIVFAILPVRETAVVRSFRKRQWNTFAWEIGWTED